MADTTVVLTDGVFDEHGTGDGAGGTYGDDEAWETLPPVGKPVKSDLSA